MTALDTSEPSTNIPLQPPPKTPAKAAGFSPVISIIFQSLRTADLAIISLALSIAANNAQDDI